MRKRALFVVDVQPQTLVAEIKEQGDFKVINYAKIKNGLKRFSAGVDTNMALNAWERVVTMDVNRIDKSIDLVRDLHIVSEFPPGCEYVFRRFSATGGRSCGLPIITIYRKKQN